MTNKAFFGEVPDFCGILPVDLLGDITKLSPMLIPDHDILLADFSHYAVGIRKEMRLESSVHVAFQTDEIAHRCIVRVDGQPLWDEALTLEDGSTTVSPFIVLGDRA